MHLIYTHALVRRLLGSLGLSGSMTSNSWTHSYSKQSCERYNPPPDRNISHHPLPSHLPLYAIHNITIVVKKLLKIFKNSKSAKELKGTKEQSCFKFKNNIVYIVM